MSRWTSKGAILRDLSRAQGGCGAPDQLRHTLGAADRPPALCIVEETEEEYFQHGASVAEGGVVSRPDLGLIQQMLDMVRDLNVSEDEVSTNDIAVISKMSPEAAMFIPCSAQRTAKLPPADEVVAGLTPALIDVPPPKKPKEVRKRNIALESILRSIKSQDSYNDVKCNGEPLRLLKPEDLIPNIEENISEIPSTTCIHNDRVQMCDQPKGKDTQTCDNSCDPEAKKEVVEKVNNWMTQMMSPIRTESTKRATLSIDSSSMFKKKTKRDLAKPTSTLMQTTVEPSKVREKFVPSLLADHYYEQYVEKNVLEAIDDDIWTKAEKKMMEIDKNKRMEAARRVDEARQRPGDSSEAEARERPDVDPLRRVRLAAPRHALGAPCVVCCAMLRHGVTGCAMLRHGVTGCAMLRHGVTGYSTEAALMPTDRSGSDSSDRGDTPADLNTITLQRADALSDVTDLSECRLVGV